MFNHHLTFPFFILFLLIACGKKEVVINDRKPVEFPSRTVENAEIKFNEAGQELIFAKGKLIEEYGFRDTAYTVFSKGISLVYYESNKPNPGKLTANYAKITPLKQLYEAKGNVVVITSDGDTIKSEMIYWNRKKKLIYSPVHTVISKFDHSTINAMGGIEASEDLKNYTLKNDNGFAYPK